MSFAFDFLARLQRIFGGCLGPPFTAEPRYGPSVPSPGAALHSNPDNALIIIIIFSKSIIRNFATQCCLDNATKFNVLNKVNFYPLIRYCKIFAAHRRLHAPPMQVRTTNKMD